MRRFLNIKSYWPSWPLFSWSPYTHEKLHTLEQKMLDGNRGAKYRQEMVFIDDENKIGFNTVIVGEGPPLVLLHGFGAGLGFWTANLQKLSKHHTVYAIDLMGFGKSSRPKFHGKTVKEAKEYFVDPFEKIHTKK